MSLYLKNTTIVYDVKVMQKNYTNCTVKKIGKFCKHTNLNFTQITSVLYQTREKKWVKPLENGKLTVN